MSFKHELLILSIMLFVSESKILSITRGNPNDQLLYSGAFGGSERMKAWSARSSDSTLPSNRCGFMTFPHPATATGESSCCLAVTTIWRFGSSAGMLLSVSIVCWSVVAGLYEIQTYPRSSKATNASSIGCPLDTTAIVAAS